MEDKPTDRILDLYENIKGVKFQGIYHGTKDFVSSNGRTYNCHLVEVVSSHVKSKMSSIVNCDPNNYVWKAITEHTFWAMSLNGVPSEGRCCFMIENVTLEFCDYNDKFDYIIKIDLNSLTP